MSRRYLVPAGSADTTAGHVTMPATAVSGAGHRTASRCDVRSHRGVPEQFLWRDRLYQVREVLEQWCQSRAWWLELEEVPVAADYRTWRVEAAAGRSASPGVYELTFDPRDGQWYLVRVVD